MAAGTHSVTIEYPKEFNLVFFFNFESQRSQPERLLEQRMTGPRSGAGQLISYLINNLLTQCCPYGELMTLCLYIFYNNRFHLSCFYFYIFVIHRPS